MEAALAHVVKKKAEAAYGILVRHGPIMSRPTRGVPRAFFLHEAK